MSVPTLLLLFHLLVVGEILTGSRRLTFLRDQPVPPETCPHPSVTLIAAARDEAVALPESLAALRRIAYPNLRFILVDDRSSDATGAILTAVAAQDRRFSILRIESLPDGWLGKNHALWQAAQSADSDLLLFTDADVIFSSDSLSRAVTCLQQDGLDHLAVTPEVRMPTGLLNLFGLTFGFFFALFTRPWRAGSSRSRCHIGIGAFNLVRTTSYRAVGGHQRIALRPDDDLKLGKILKYAGYRQQLALGTGLISVCWYNNWRELLRGLEKNLFAGTEYRIWLSLGSVLCLLAGWFWPYLGLLASSGSAQLVYLVCVALISLQVADGARRYGGRRWYVLGFPLTVLLLAGITLRTLMNNLLRGGITWRDTFYPLDELRRNRIDPPFRSGPPDPG